MEETLDKTDAPLRCRASPRSSRTNSLDSGSSFNGFSEDSGPHTESSEAQSPTRGRSLIRTPPRHTHDRRMTVIHQDGPDNVKWDNGLVQQRLMSRDLTVEPLDIFDSIKEPLPFGTERYRSSLSEELFKAATWDTSIDLSRFANHRDTFAIIGLRYLQTRRIGLPDAFFQQLLPYIDFSTFLAIRLSCRCWSEAITRVRRVITQPIYQLPFEILEKVYSHLDPMDFNSARHTCRAWMITSLEENMLTQKLKYGGWWRAAKADVDLQEQLEGRRTVESVNEEWMLSKRLATECSLRPDWKGNGLSNLLIPLTSNNPHSYVCLRITSSTDFSELSNGFNPVGAFRHRPAVHFTASVCNGYLLVIEGCLIYIYSIQDSTSIVQPFGSHLSTVATVVCPHRVLAASMDTSSQRFAIAVLMDDRIGMVCDLSDMSISADKHSTPRALPTAIRDSRGQMYSPRSSNEHVMTEATNPHEYSTAQIAYDRAMARTITEATLPEIHGARTTRQSWTLNDPFLSPIEAPGSSENYGSGYGQMPIAAGSRSVYRNLCSTEDPPRSVAICPQRRCVAYGCAAGIELHWTDSLTGQDLNRWFPLTAPSDFLYFLPPRPVVDSTKKLRLISSAAHPKEREGLEGRFFPSSTDDGGRQQDMTWNEEFRGISLGNNVWRGGGWCDHYRAVPLSDGWNILFTDPEEGTLCLGSDAPPGDLATRLTRRFTFTGPVDSEGDIIVPRVYATGRELRWGVRIVVGYGESIWFFSVPPDVYFAANKPPGAATASDGADLEVPMRIDGIQIGKVPALVDVALDASGGDVTVFAFAADGMAYTWQIAADTRPEQQRVVARDGSIMPLVDADGDTFMHNTMDRAVHFDGNGAVTPMGHHSSADRAIDTEGATVVEDALHEDEGYESAFEAAGGTFAIHAPPVWARWSDNDADWVPNYLDERGDDVDVHDEGVGMCFLDIDRVEVEVLGR